MASKRPSWCGATDKAIGRPSCCTPTHWTRDNSGQPPMVPCRLRCSSARRWRCWPAHSDDPLGGHSRGGIDVACFKFRILSLFHVAVACACCVRKWHFWRPCGHDPYGRMAAGDTTACSTPWQLTPPQTLISVKIQKHKTAKPQRMNP